MGKARKPRKPTEAEPKTELVPAPRSLPIESPAPRAAAPALFNDLVETLRTAALKLLDLADAAAEAITKQLERRA